MSTLKAINVVHPSGSVTNIVNDNLGNITVGNNLTVAGTLTGSTGVMNIGSGQVYKDSSGNVGIGTSSPSYPLVISKNQNASTVLQTINNNAGASAAVILQSQIGASSYVNYSTFAAYNQIVGSGITTQYIDFDTQISRNNAGSERMRIDSSGNLLVGYTTSNGSYKLQVNSQIFATSSTIATSDARYKQNVQTLNGALSIVKALRPVSFDWKKHPVHAFDTENTTVGFLAQEVQQVLADKPYLNSIIKKNECVIEPEVKDGDGVVTTAAVTEEFLGIAEGNMIAILTAAIQELSAKNDALEARLAVLETK
jgi:hypothetical protein